MPSVRLRSHRADRILSPRREITITELETFIRFHQLEGIEIRREPTERRWAATFRQLRVTVYGSTMTEAVFRLAYMIDEEKSR